MILSVLDWYNGTDCNNGPTHGRSWDEVYPKLCLNSPHMVIKEIRVNRLQQLEPLMKNGVKVGWECMNYVVISHHLHLYINS